MVSEEGAFRSCFADLLDKFTTYDQAVDVVSCWESILRYGYKNELKYFDRFPNIPPRDLTPDFTVLFKKKYGIVFEVKRTFPKDEEGFKKEIKQLLSYDNKLKFKADKSEKRIIPTLHDIVLVVSAVNSNEIFNRFNKIISNSDEFNFNNNVILIEYFYHTGDRDSRYVFRKYMGENGAFHDDSLPKDKRFENILGANAKSFVCYPRHFIKYKVNEVFCNDKPPELYMSVFLWTKVLYSYLTEDQKNEWKRGNAQKIQNITINIDNLLNDLNTKFIPQGNIRRRWVTDAFKFLEDAGLAERKRDNKVKINFRNLTQMIGHRKYVVEGEDVQEDMREYGHLIADQYCKSIVGEKKVVRKPIQNKKKYMQKKLFHD